jgi:hypothetical protein
MNEEALPSACGRDDEVTFGNIKKTAFAAKLELVQ